MKKMQCIGRLGKDAELKTLQGGKQVINFSVGITENVKGEKKTAWVECSYFTEKTGILPYLKKGAQVYVEGNPSARAWKNNSGEAQATQELFVHSVQLLGSAQQNGQATGATANQGEPVENLPWD
jgi:single-strand DNA-binding protein